MVLPLTAAPSDVNHPTYRSSDRHAIGEALALPCRAVRNL